MQSVRVMAVLLLSLGCVSVTYADNVPVLYDQDITSSDSVQMDSLTRFATNEPGTSLDQYDQYTDNNDNNDNSGDDERDDNE